MIYLYMLKVTLSIWTSSINVGSYSYTYIISFSACIKINLATLPKFFDNNKLKYFLSWNKR